MSLPTRIVKRKNRKGYWTYWYDTKKGRKWKKLAEKKTLAQKLLNQLRDSLLNIKKKYEPGTLNTYYKKYKKDYLYETSSRSWSGKQRMHFERYILPNFGRKFISEISLYDVEAWYKKLCKNHPRKYSNHIAGSFKRMLKRAEGKYLERSPIANLKLLASERRIPDHFSRSEIKSILKKSTDPERALIIFWLHTGLRLGEIQFLQVRDIDIKKQKVYIKNKKEHRIKDCEDRIIDLTTQATAEISKLIKNKKGHDFVYTTPEGTVYKNLSHRIIRYFKKIKHRGNGNLIRHTFASLFLSSGGSLAELKQYMGHSTIQTTERHYAAFIPGEKSSIHNVNFET